MIKSKLIKYFALIALLFTAIGAALSIGYVPLGGLFKVIFFTDKSSLEYLVLSEIRFPRVLLAVLVGAALGLAGLLAQGAFANPLAEPAIIGSSSGAALGSIIAFSIGLESQVLNMGFAIFGSIILSFLTFKLAVGANQPGPLLILIIGIAISAIGIALVGIISSLFGASGSRSISFWYFGSLALANMEYVYLIVIALIFSVLLLKGLGPKLDLLSFGDLQFKHWGFSPNQTRAKSIFIMSVLTGAAVSAVGSIAFLGLAAPHIARSLFGYKHSQLFIVSGLIGAIILLISDTLARSLAGSIELPLGFFTAIIGAPFLIWLARAAVLRNINA